MCCENVDLNTVSFETLKEYSKSHARAAVDIALDQTASLELAHQHMERIRQIHSIGRLRFHKSVLPIPESEGVI